MSKHKRTIFADDVLVNIDAIQMRKTTYNTIKKTFKVGSLPLMIKYFRDLLDETNTKYIGKYKDDDLEGHHFRHGNINIISSKDFTMFIAAFKDQKNEIIEVKNIKAEEQQNCKTISRDKKIKIGDREYNECDMNISNHADKRITERFFITVPELKRKFCLHIIKSGQYLGLHFDNVNLSERANHLFVKNNIHLYVAVDSFDVVTLVEGKIGYYNTGKTIISPIIKTKLNGAKRKYRTIKKRHAFTELDIQEQIINYKRMILKTRSELKRNEYQDEINKLTSQLKQMEEERKAIKQDLKDLKYLYGCLV